MRPLAAQKQVRLAARVKPEQLPLVVRLQAVLGLLRVRQPLEPQSASPLPVVVQPQGSQDVQPESEALRLA